METQRVNSPEPRGPAAETDSVPEVLTSSQLHALFDILTHHETYAEVESFKDPATISEYGYPFARRDRKSAGASYAANSSTPLLAGVLRSIVLPCPGVRDLPAEFWHVRFQGILEKLAEVGLSESYDKGVLGTRKTLATAASAIHEMVTRGIIGRIAKGETRNLHNEYDRSNSKELARAWDDVVHELLYGSLLDELFSCAADRQSLEEHSPAVQAAADCIIIHLATLLHRVFVLSAEGPYLLKLLENVHKLLPYSMIKQTLRIGNAATMLSGMMRLLLAKMGVGALSNWFGLTHNADDGMNLLQRIIWLVLSWDSLEFRKSADGIEKAKGRPGPSKEQLALIKDYVDKPKNKHVDTRHDSIQEHKSMIVTILERSNPDVLGTVSDSQHAQCLEYLSALLSARDRDEITNTLCRQNPDLFTQAVKDAVASFESMIRAIHQHVDLREHVSAAEGFLSEVISISKPKKGSSGLLDATGNGATRGDSEEGQAPSVEDYVVLLRRNRQLLYNWLHQVASQCPDLRDDFLAWAKETSRVFRQDEPASPEFQLRPGLSVSEEARPADNTTTCSGGAGAMSSSLQQLFASQPAETRSLLLPALDAHAAYLSALQDLSLARMQRILDNMNHHLSSHSAPPTPTRQPSPSYFSPGYWSGRSSPAPPPVHPPRSKTPTACSFSGPGMYLSRWQHLLDETLIGPATREPGAPLRRGRDVKSVLARGKTTSSSKDRDGSGSNGWDPAALARMAEAEEPRAPDVGVVVQALGEGFKTLVGGLIDGAGKER